MPPLRQRIARAAALAALLTALPGCGGDRLKTAPVKGTITYQDKPVPHGTVMFQPENGPAATGEIANGRYTLTTYKPGDGAVLGAHKVTIISLQDQSNRLPEHRNPLPPPVVPLRYSFADKSGLAAKVEDKPNVFDFHLK
jgi:hypothetical protein